MAYALISSTKFDPSLTALVWNNDLDGVPCPFFLLHMHLDRLRNAAAQHDWTDAAAALSLPGLLSLCFDAVDRHPDCPQACKIRITLSRAGDLSVAVTSSDPFSIDPTLPSLFNPDTGDPSPYGLVLTIFVDTQSTETSLFTLTKTTRRDVYDDARIRAAITPLSHSDVILYNSRGSLTEASIYNFALHRSGNWVTPSSSTGCLPGVMRRWLLEQGRIREDDENTLTRDCLREGEWVLLFNGVQGCRLGRIKFCDRVSQSSGIKNKGYL